MRALTRVGQTQLGGLILPIEFSCSQCQCELKVAEAAVGKKARCPRCGMIHDVPKQPASPSSDTRASQSRSSESPGSLSETRYRPNSDMHEKMRIGHEGSNWSMKTPDGSVYGPVSQVELDSWVSDGRVSSECLVQLEGQSHWQSAIVLYPHLASLKSSVPPQSRNISRPARQPVGTRRRLTRTARANSGVTVFVLSILGFFMLFFPVFHFCGFLLGRSERRGIENGQVSDDSRGWLDAGYALCIIGLCFSGLMFVGCCLTPMMN